MFHNTTTPLMGVLDRAEYTLALLCNEHVLPAEPLPERRQRRLMLVCKLDGKTGERKRPDLEIALYIRLRQLPTLPSSGTPTGLGARSAER